MLPPKQRQFLKGLAHSLAPVVRIGKEGLTATVIEETKKSLLAHELIKVRFESAEGPERRDMAGDLAQAAGAELAGTIGRVAILYRAREEKPKLKLPR